MEHPRGAFKANSARFVRAVKELLTETQTTAARQQLKRSKFVQEI
ncbi:hypothetical protein [Bradyrhizobium sp. URHC0002]